MLALCEALGMPVNFIAPAFGFQKNMPYPDNGALRALIERQWEVSRRFGASIGFHSGSGKSAENYRVMGEVTGGRPGDQDQRPLHLRDGRGALPLERRLRPGALGGLVPFHGGARARGPSAPTPTESKMARTSSRTRSPKAGRGPTCSPRQAACRAAVEALPRAGPHVLLRVQLPLRARGRREGREGGAGDHSAAGFRPAGPVLPISPEAPPYLREGRRRLHRVPRRAHGPRPGERCAAARRLLARIGSYEAFLERDFKYQGTS